MAAWRESPWNSEENPPISFATTQILIRLLSKVNLRSSWIRGNAAAPDPDYSSMKKYTINLCKNQLRLQKKSRLEILLTQTHNKDLRSTRFNSRALWTTLKVENNRVPLCFWAVIDAGKKDISLNQQSLETLKMTWKSLRRKSSGRLCQLSSFLTMMRLLRELMTRCTGLLLVLWLRASQLIKNWLMELEPVQFMLIVMMFWNAIHLSEGLKIQVLAGS